MRLAPQGVGDQGSGVSPRLQPANMTYPQHLRKNVDVATKDSNPAHRPTGHTQEWVWPFFRFLEGQGRSGNAKPFYKKKTKIIQRPDDFFLDKPCTDIILIEYSVN